jgi:uncharacterized cupredoxin-like copper-binding protein
MMMILAHTFTPGGPDIEFLVLAFALLSLAIVLFFQKTAKRQVPFILLVASLAMGAGAFAVGGSAPDAGSGAGITVNITNPSDGAQVPAGKPISLEVDLNGGTIVAETSSTDPSAGHYHVFVDRELVDMPTSDTPTVRLEPGEHEVAVEFTDTSHAQFSPRIIDTVTVVAK